jgi:Tfp pilus assembly protein PilO
MNRKLFAQISQLAQRYPFCATCIVLSVLLAAAGVWLQIDLNDLTALQQQRARDGDQMLISLARGSQLRSEQAVASAAAKRINENLVVEKNVPENFWYFYKIEQDTQTKLTELQQRPALIPDTGAPTTYKRVPYSVRLTGSFRSAISFLQRLETGPRFGRVDAFAIQRQDPTTSNVALQLDLQLLGQP